MAYRVAVKVLTGGQDTAHRAEKDHPELDPTVVLDREGTVWLLLLIDAEDEGEAANAAARVLTDAYLKAAPGRHASEADFSIPGIWRADEEAPEELKPYLER